jgi:two-component system response regulator NreC
MIREILVNACGRAVPGAVVGEAGDGAAAVAASRKHPPDLVILDVELPDIDGFDLMGDLLAIAPKARIIALSSHTDEFTLHRAMQCRVNGFVDKNEQPLEVLRAAISTVMADKTYYSPVVERVKASLRADPAAFTKLLSEHEQRLLTLMGRGLSNEEIGRLLELSAVTVKTHRRNIMGKLGFHSTPELIRYAIDKGFIRPGLARNALRRGAT